MKAERVGADTLLAQIVEDGSEPNDPCSHPAPRGQSRFLVCPRSPGVLCHHICRLGYPSVPNLSTRMLSSTLSQS